MARPILLFLSLFLFPTALSTSCAGRAAAQEASSNRGSRWTMAAWSPERQEASFELHYALVDYRPIGSAAARWSRGSEFGFGTRSTTLALPFRLTWTSDPTLRVLDSKSFALSIVQTVRVGLALGPVEPEIGGGFSTLTADVFHGDFSFEMLSPRAVAGLWIHIGNLRLGVEGYGEYLWRWLGDTNYLLRGVAFELSAGGVHGGDGNAAGPR